VMIGGELYLTRGQIMTMSEEDLAAGFRKLVQTYIPVQHLRVPREKAGTRAKILPLLPDQERSGAAREGFQEGFEAKEEPVPPPPARPDRPDRELRSLPELSKDVRRVFGDDDV